MISKPYEIKLDIFEGPMDLLVHLIKKHEVDIYDIPIALITNQFLEYIELLKSMNIDSAGDFLLMAATLAKIKSAMLLPTQEGEEDEEDPRLEITRPLLEYLQIKSAAEQLYERDILGKDTFSRIPVKGDFPVGSEDKIIKVGLFELIDAFKKILDNISEDHRIDFSADRISVKDRITEIIDILEEKRSIVFSEIFSSSLDKSDVVITFLALLEMVKLGLIQVAQHVQSGIIRLFYI